MAGRTLPPRQKMINMMYLVLTAILALNVSKEVLDSFVRLDTDLVRSERSHAVRSADEYARFAEAARRIPEKYQEPYGKALAIRSQADSLVHHIERMKAMVLAECEGLAMEDVLKHNADGTDSLMALASVARKDDRDALTRLLVGSEPGAPKTGPNTASDLKQRVAGFRDLLKEQVGPGAPEMMASLDRLFDLGDQRDASGTMNNWESLNFYDVPVVAGIASLSKLQADIRSAESDVVKWMHGRVEGDIYKVDRLMAAVIPQSDQVMVGDTFRADVFLAAYDSRNTPDIFFGAGMELPVAADGRAQLRLPAPSVGPQAGEGKILFRGPNGPMEFPYQVNYQVVSPTLVASPTKMNVLYRHVENPIELSVPGVSADRVSASISNGTIVRGPNGSWIAKPGQGTDAKVDAIVSMPDGGTRRVGPALFRVKDLPAPSAVFVGKTATDSKLTVAELKAGKCLQVRLLGTEFNVPFEVVSFDLQILHRGQIIPKHIEGGCLGPNEVTAKDALRPGDRIMMVEIKARLQGIPDAPVYSVSGLNLRVS